MEDTQLIIHHGINGFIKQVHGQEMSRSIDHQAPVNESRLVNDLYWQFFLNTVFELVPGTFEGLQESLQPTNQTDKGLRLQTGLLFGNVQGVGLLFGREDAAEFRLFDLHC